MDPRQMKDPAAGVPSQLLPHFHLISKHRYPVLNNPSLETIVGYLLEAPRIMREVAPVQWQFLDAPPDGSLFLTWQPLEYLNTNFASDGYVWGDQETTFNSEVRGYTLQMFWHRTGYKPQAEAVATHSRRRYRLIPSNQQMGLPQPDPALFLVHYSKAQQRDQLPAAQLQMMPMVHQQFQQRRMIQAGGQLPRKEFMLHDRSSWPVINAPGGRQGPAVQAAATHRRGQSLGHEVTLEEEEDVSRGDALDFMTPRDISRMRYEQHHEWMEEILESPYATKDIIPPELGLGRKGPLESLTNGFFTAPMISSHEANAGNATKVGRMDAGKAEEFTQLANQRLVEMQEELEKMKQVHIKRMEKLRKTTELSAAERKVRTANSNDAMNDEEFEAVTEKVENLVGKSIGQISNVSCLAKGGLQHIQPIAPPTPQQNGTANAASLPKQPSPQDQVTLPQAQQDTDAPVQPNEADSQVQSQGESPAVNDQLSAAVQGDPSSEIKQPTELLQSPSAAVDDLADIGDTAEDVDMAGLEDELVPNEDHVGDVGDWDMIGDEPVVEDTDQKPLVSDEQVSTDEKAKVPAVASENPQPEHEVAADQTPGAGADFDMVDDFDTNMDTAGDALADYNADGDLGLDDSAFGDAFHHHEDDLS